MSQDSQPPLHPLSLSIPRGAEQMMSLFQSEKARAIAEAHNQFLDLQRRYTELEQLSLQHHRVTEKSLADALHRETNLHALLTQMSGELEAVKGIIAAVPGMHYEMNEQTGQRVLTCYEVWRPHLQNSVNGVTLNWIPTEDGGYGQPPSTSGGTRHANFVDIVHVLVPSSSFGRVFPRSNAFFALPCYSTDFALLELPTIANDLDHFNRYPLVLLPVPADIFLRRGHSQASSSSSTYHSLLAAYRSIFRSFLFPWDEKIDGGAESFLIMVEDVDGEVILFHDTFVLRQRYAEDEHNVTLTVPIFEPVPPNYYISIIPDQWLHSETRLPISFKPHSSQKSSPPYAPFRSSASSAISPPQQGV
ncbi:Sec63-domain-containing protein [Guyanagaster necrorhizus]|uniref:Sec63-domain-containing protein n=1 Tax=Guyanagaster necrorhizus TaxID=856835 RepID=A0A9P8AUS4_9AGAR|nr:Sec63-domain-containing protein [Guyanagaster necrorhizus MCA 3950]KAG7448804.1 Sec63-domain-containing protein [Guyanagaster necrorhizus MCA 3950]